MIYSKCGVGRLLDDGMDTKRPHVAARSRDPESHYIKMCDPVSYETDKAMGCRCCRNAIGFLSASARLLHLRRVR